LNPSPDNAIASKPSIKRADSDDAAIFSALRRPFWDDQIAKGLLDVPVLDEVGLMSGSMAILKRPRSSTYIAFDHEGPFGYAYGQSRVVPGAQKAIVGMVEELYVDARRGSASTALILMRRVIDDLRAMGASRVQAKVLANNPIGMRFHEMCGFKANLIFFEYALSNQREPA
jgi:hypothetical protein